MSLFNPFSDICIKTHEQIEKEQYNHFQRLLAHQDERLYHEFCQAIKERNYSLKLRTFILRILSTVKIPADYLISIYRWEGKEEKILEIRYLKESCGIYIQLEPSRDNLQFNIVVNVAHSLEQYVFSSEEQENKVLLQFLQECLDN